MSLTHSTIQAFTTPTLNLCSNLGSTWVRRWRIGANDKITNDTYGSALKKSSRVSSLHCPNDGQMVECYSHGFHRFSVWELDGFPFDCSWMLVRKRFIQDIICLICVLSDLHVVKWLWNGGRLIIPFLHLFTFGTLFLLTNIASASTWIRLNIKIQIIVIIIACEFVVGVKDIA